MQTWNLKNGQDNISIFLSYWVTFNYHWVKKNPVFQKTLTGEGHRIAEGVLASEGSHRDVSWGFRAQQLPLCFLSPAVEVNLPRLHGLCPRGKWGWCYLGIQQVPKHRARELPRFVLSTLSTAPAPVLRCQGTVKAAKSWLQGVCSASGEAAPRSSLLLHSCFCFALICSGFGGDPRVHLLQNIC